MEAQQRIVALAVGDKRAEDTRYMFRFAYAHVLEPNDRVVVLHVRIGAPAGWVPLTVGQAVGSDEAGWLPEEMRQGLKGFASAEYWQLRGLSAADAIVEFGAWRRCASATARSRGRCAHLCGRRHLALRPMVSMAHCRASRRAQWRRAACGPTCWWWARAATAA
jgi:hypothetical protein